MKNLLHLPKEKANFSKINGGRATFLWRIQVSSFRVVENAKNKKLLPEAGCINWLTNCRIMQDLWSLEMRNF